METDMQTGLFNPVALLHPKIRQKWASAERFEMSEKEMVENNTILLDGITGVDYNTRLVQAVLRRLDGQDVQVDINSPGGFAQQGMAIYNSLKKYEGKVTVNVIGAAASAAQLVALAGDEILMGEMSYMMIHRPQGIVAGTASDMESQARGLMKIEDSLNKLITSRTSYKSNQVTKMLEETTYFDADEAVDNGLADGYMKSVDNSARKTAKSVTREMVSDSHESERVDPRRAEMLKSVQGVLEETRNYRRQIGE